MKLLVLGATGRTGRAIVTDALSGGHQVTILARTPTGPPICAPCAS
jgi:uncharacterized protein YbjT (DUF2867 family)